MATENVMIATDCISDLPDEIIEKYHISTMYFYIFTEEARFQDTFEMTSDDLIEYIDSDEKKAYSGSASVEEYLEYFQGLQKGSDRDIVYICTSRHLSKAYENAMAAADQMKHVYVVDSGHLSGGLGLLVVEAAQMAQCGASAELIIEAVKEMAGRVSTTFIVDSPEYLYRCGRISKVVYVLCKALLLHPILKMRNGHLQAVGVCAGRTYRFARAYIKKILKNQEDIIKDRVFLIGVGCSYEYKEFLKKEITSNVVWDRLVVNAASATISCNCGPGTFGVLFMRKKKCC